MTPHPIMMDQTTGRAFGPVTHVWPAVSLLGLTGLKAKRRGREIISGFGGAP